MAASPLVSLLVLLLSAAYARAAPGAGVGSDLPPPESNHTTAWSVQGDNGGFDLPPPDDNDTFVLAPEQSPDTPVQKCLTRLTLDCANQIDAAIVGKTLDVTPLCCKNALFIGKTCWSLLIYTESDDPCHFFRFVIDHCIKITKPAGAAGSRRRLATETRGCNYAKLQEYKKIAEAAGEFS